MKIEDQVVSLELATRLKELNVKQDSYFYWYYYNRTDWKVEPHGQLPSFAFPCDENCISAFTASELGKMLPKYIKAETLLPEPNDKIAKFYLCYDENGYPSYDFYENEISPGYKKENEANARAKMLIYLIENDLSPL